MTETKADKLVTENIRLVGMVVKRFGGNGTEPEDLFQIGCLGLVKAARDFDGDRGVRFSTYAVSKIVGEIRSYLRDAGSVKVSRTLKRDRIRVKRAADSITAARGRSATVSEIAEALGMTPEDIAECMEIPENVLSLDGAFEEGGNRYEITAGDTGEEDLERIILAQALDKLEAAERRVIVMRYFLDRTQSEVASLIGCSQVTVSRMEKNILKKLKKMIL